MFDGDLAEGELEAGMGLGRITSVLPAARIIDDMLREYRAARTALPPL